MGPGAKRTNAIVRFLISIQFNVSIGRECAGKDRSKTNFPHTCLEHKIQGRKERQYNKIK